MFAPMSEDERVETKVEQTASKSKEASDSTLDSYPNAKETIDNCTTKDEELMQELERRKRKKEPTGGGGGKRKPYMFDGGLGGGRGGKKSAS